jgi:hypothetical protein
MKKKNRLRLIVYVSLVSLIIFHQFGRSIWHPVYVKIVGKKTSKQVYEKIGKKVEEKWDSYYKKIGLEKEPTKICIIVLKNEQMLEVWTSDLEKNKLITKYKMTAFSGNLGPKLKSGDLQIPEGIYNIEYLNPNSSYYLSMKINYPNNNDIQNAKNDNRTNLGGDIFIHGKAVTIGCIPIGDKNIEELFILVYKLGLSNIEVIIAPNDLRFEKSKYKNSDLKWLESKYTLIESELNKYNN